MTSTIRGTFGDGPLVDTPIEIFGNPTSDRLALVVGNKTYGGKAELRNALHDAEQFAKSVERVGFLVILGRNLKREQIIDALRITQKKMETPRSVALFYYAGHGVQVDGTNYLIPIGADIEERLDLERALDLDYVNQIIAEGANTHITFLDACRENRFARNLLKHFSPETVRKTGEPLPSEGRVRGGFRPIENYKNAFIAFASAPHKVAFDGDTDHSPFTRALLKHIETPDLSFHDMMIDVTDAVLIETKGKQQPWFFASSSRHFYFATSEHLPPAVASSNSREAEKEFAAAMKRPTIAGLSHIKRLYPELGYQVDAEIDRIRRADEARRNVEQEERPAEADVDVRTAQPPLNGEQRRSRKAARLKRLLSGNSEIE